MTDLLTRSATQLAALVRSGEVSARELVESSLRRIDELEPQVGAFTHVAHEYALAAAAAINPGDERPFAGVPIAIKDNRAVAGMPLSFGSDLFAGLVPPHDTSLVRRLKEAGFVIVGKTKLPEMGILPTSEPRRFGPARNPWNLDRTPGGSSGGSAAAVAAGMIPIAHGNDGGGSTRIPAACCGLVGLKPARGRISVGPEQGESLLVVDGVLTRTVPDTAAVLDVLSGPELGDASWASPPERPYAESAGEEPPPLRIGMTLVSPLAGTELHPECELAVTEAAALLESLGHTVEEVEPPWAGTDLLPDFTKVFGPMTAMQVFIGGRLAGREPTPEDVEPLTWANWELARSLSSIDFQAALGTLQTVGRQLISWMEPYDVLLTPALAQRPLQIGTMTGYGEDPWSDFRRSGLFTPYTAIFNVTGQPAISLPTRHGADGLPSAVQLVGRPAREDLLLALATQIERAAPWAGRLSPLAEAH